MKSLILTYVKYNCWANSKLRDRISELDNERLRHEVKSSFSSLITTIEHIYDAESIWLERLKGKPINYWPSRETSFSLVDWITQSKRFLEFVKRRNEQFFNNLCTYQNFKGDYFQQSNFEIIMHCMNHSTFHRGQVVTILRQLDEKNIPQTDLIRYLR